MSLQLKSLPWEYEAYQQIIEETEQSFTPAYMHGMTWSILITLGEKGMSNIPFFQKLTDEERALFKNLYDISTQQLQDENMGIDLLLPDDEVSLSYRLETLIDWCEGFLQGIQLADTFQPNVVSLPKAQAILKDIDAMRELHCDEVSTEENERYYCELIEFIRVAVLLLEVSLHEPPDTVIEKGPLLH